MQKTFRSSLLAFLVISTAHGAALPLLPTPQPSALAQELRTAAAVPVAGYDGDPSHMVVRKLLSNLPLYKELFSEVAAMLSRAPRGLFHRSIEEATHRLEMLLNNPETMVSVSTLPVHKDCSYAGLALYDYLFRAQREGVLPGLSSLQTALTCVNVPRIQHFTPDELRGLALYTVLANSLMKPSSNSTLYGLACLALGIVSIVCALFAETKGLQITYCAGACACIIVGSVLLHLTHKRALREKAEYHQWQKELILFVYTMLPAGPQRAAFGALVHRMIDEARPHAFESDRIRLAEIRADMDAAAV